MPRTSSYHRRVRRDVLLSRGCAGRGEVVFQPRATRWETGEVVSETPGRWWVVPCEAVPGDEAGQRADAGVRAGGCVPQGHAGRGEFIIVVANKNRVTRRPRARGQRRVAKRRAARLPTCLPVGCSRRGWGLGLGVVRPDRTGAAACAGIRLRPTRTKT